MKGRVLIITATTANRVSYLVELLESVQSQTYSNFIHLIIDNSSEGLAKDLIATYSLKDHRLKYLHLPFLQSPAGARNAGLYTKYAQQSEYIKWLDDDDKFYTNTSLATLVQGFTNDTVMVYGQQEYISNTGERIYIKPAQKLDRHRILIQSSFPCSSMMFKKDFISKLGGFNWYKSTEDIDLVLRAMTLAKKINKEIIFISDIITCYRKHDGGIGYTNRLNGEKARIKVVLNFIYANNIWEYFYLQLRSRAYVKKKLMKNTLSLKFLKKRDTILKLNREFY